MRLLLDTHVLLWAVAEPGHLSAAIRDDLENPENEVLFSAASIWEIAIKAGLGRVDFAVRPERIALAARETGFIELAVTARAAARVVDLPTHHRDPFDRVLVAQAMLEPARLYTADPLLLPYSDLVELIG